MLYAEESYPFPGSTPHHFQHIAARDEHLRLQRKQDENRRAFRERRQNSRCI